MTVTYWGVRGSYPSPGAHTLRYGGHTTCVSVETDEAVLVLDVGTGAEALGAAILAAPAKPILVLFTHAHVDHLLGLPFFAPLYARDRTVHLFDLDLDGHAWSPLSIFGTRLVSPALTDLSCAPRRVAPADAGSVLRAHGFEVHRLRVNHPGGAYAYRIAHGGSSLVFAPDSELDPPRPSTPAHEIAAFCDGADVLIHDAQYVDADLPFKHGWGHSLVHQACALADAAGVGRLVLFHHDPHRSDDAIDALQAESRLALGRRGIACDAAFQGGTLVLGPAASAPVLRAA